MRKLIWTLVCIIIGVKGYYLLLSNPIALEVMNEFAFTSDGWALEIVVPYDWNATNWYLVTKQDTAYIKPVKILGNTPYLITQDSLLESLNINTSGDDLRLYDYGGMPLGSLEFGSSQNASVRVPRIGQSISKIFGLYCLDNTPSLGQPNDRENINGTIAGWIKDGSDLPLQNVKIAYLVISCGTEGCVDHYDTTLTNSAGYFTFSSLARLQSLSFSKQNYVTQQYSKVQVWPDSTFTINITMSPLASVEKTESQVIPKNFFISEPFPNPFNPETQIQYTLPRNGNVRIDVFDMSGRLVDKIFSGKQSLGSYRARWNASHFPSGAYIVRIQTDEITMSKKCVVVK